MARELEVRVKADTTAYQKAMLAAVSSTDELGQAGLRIQKVGLGFSQLGDTLTKNVTVPLALVGGLAIKSAADFDNAFTRMQTLAGTSAGEVDALKESVLDLAGQTGRAPQELAEALYFLSSSGLDSAQAMEALEVSAKASAAGLGDTATIADAVSSAMLGYAEAGLTAAEATDVLVATAREGKAEPAELAAQMGRLIPVASELGITFGDVGGAIAALSTKGFNAEQATTALVNVMAKLLKPSEQAAELLADVGLSTDTIRQSIAEKGLLATLEELRAKLGDAGFVKFLEDQQAVQGGLALLGGDLNKTKEIFDEVNNSVGATENAFSKWADSMGADNAQAFAQFQVALIQVGEVLAPIASDVLSFVASIAEAFSGLPDGAQNVLIAFGVIAAAMGPLMSVGGRLITVVGTLVRLFPELAAPAGAVSGAFTGAAVSTSAFSTALLGLTRVTLVVGALIALRAVLQGINDDIQKANLSELENQLLKLGQTGEVSGATLRRVFSVLGGNMSELDVRQFAADLDQLDAGLAKLAARDPHAAAAAFKEISDAMREQGASASEIRSKFDDYRSALAEADTASQTASGAIAETEDAMAGLGSETENTISKLQEYADILKAQFDPLFGMISASNGLRDSQTQVAEAQGKLNEALAGGDPTAIAAAQRDYDDALFGAQESLAEVQQAQLTLNDAITKGDVNLGEAQQQMYDWAIQAGFTSEEALIMAGQLGTAAGAAQWLGAQDPNVAVSATGIDNTIGALGRVHAAVAELPSSKNIEINFNVRVPPGVDVGKVLTFRQHGGPVKAGEAYIVGEQRPEVFVPKTDGIILPRVSDLVPGSAPLGHSGMGGGTMVHYTINVAGGLASSSEIGTRVVESIQAFERSNGSGWRNS
jgi:TP901 family phage tail tape measure protein